MLTIVPLLGIPEVVAGDDLVPLLLEAVARSGCAFGESDVLVVTQKIVSKAEGQFRRLSDFAPGAKAIELAALTRKDPRLVELVLRESSEVVRAAPHVLITRHRLGHVMANAGIDRSNIGGGRDDEVLLLPHDPDETARRIHAAFAAHGPAPAIVISDSFGRPWRNGVVNVAIGVAGLPAVQDQRGQADRDGRVLEVTQVALADMIATAAGLAMGEGAQGVPAVLVRGCAWSEPPSDASALIRPIEEDLFR